MHTMTPRANLPTDRSFGLLFTFVSLAVSGYGYYKGWSELHLKAGLIAGSTLFLISLLLPILLRPFNLVWFWIGQILNKIVSPIVLGILFFGLLTPIAVISRLFGRDVLRLKKCNIVSYWIDRSASESPSTSFENQF